MKRPAIDVARGLLRRRRFSDAVRVLNDAREFYENSFDYHYTLGTAYLYIGDSGNAAFNYERARKIKVNDSKLLMGQAAIFLRRGDVERAVQYYLEILENEPENKYAKAALEFVRRHGDYETICRWADDGRLMKYYPALGINYVLCTKAFAALCIGVLFGSLIAYRLTYSPVAKGPRADLTSLALTSDEASELKERDMSGGVYHYILSDREIKKAYEDSASLFQQYRDNAAQREVNLILNSNASVAVKQKARILMGYFSEPTFDSLKDNFTYREVSSDLLRYIDCWVDWSGRVSSVVTEGNSQSFDLLVGYADMKNLEGIVKVYFAIKPVPEIDGEKAVRVLGKVSVDESGKVVLKGKSVFQSVKGEF